MIRSNANETVYVISNKAGSYEVYEFTSQENMEEELAEYDWDRDIRYFRVTVEAEITREFTLTEIPTDTLD